MAILSAYYTTFGISEKLNKTEEEIAASDFYDKYYQEMRSNGWTFNDNWVMEKIMLGRKIFDMTNSSIDDKIISLGAGTGICEMEALRGEGYNIELHEVQDSSLDYLETNGVKPTRVWITSNLSVLPSETYDLAILNHILYVFDDSKYIDFMSDVNRILKTGARAIVTVENVSEFDCIRGNVARNRFLRRVFGKIIPGYFGGLRTISYHKRLLSTLKSYNRYSIKELTRDKI